MEKKIKKIFTVLLFASLSMIFAQQKKGIEYSGFFDSYYFRGPIAFTLDAGVNLYFGDLSKRNIGPNVSLGVIYKQWPRVAFGGEFTFISASAEDHVETRGYKYDGTNLGLTAYTRYYLREDIVQRHNQLRKVKKFKPYFQFGVTGLYFNPTTTDTNGDKLDQESNFPVTLAIPAGLGADLILSDRITIAPEFLYYYTFSDNLDNVSKNNAVGVSNAKDSYLTMGIKITYSPFSPRKKAKKLSKKEVELLMHNNEGNGNSGEKNTTGDVLNDGGQGSVSDTKTEEEYQSDEDLLQLEPEDEEIIEDDLSEEDSDFPDEENIEEDDDSESGDDSWGF